MASLSITINNPPVNALSPGVPEGLVAALDAAEKDPSARAIVIIGGGRTFIAGADIKELELAAAGRGSGPPEFHGILARIEDSTKPVVMAIHGTALGGGLELAMAGHYRVAVPDAQVGQPEVNLGIIPGAEGTQRLPRLVGVAAAVDLCVSGKPIRAPEALKLGLIDRVIEGDLLTGAVAFAREIADQGGALRKTRELTDKLGSEFVNAPIFVAGRDQARKTRRNMLAPLKVVDAIEAAVNAALRRRLQERARDFRGVHRLRSGTRADPCVFRRTRGGQDPRHSQGDRRSTTSARPPSSAPAPWAAASRWPAPMPAFPCCSKKRNRRRSIAAWPPFARTTKTPSRRAASRRR